MPHVLSSLDELALSFGPHAERIEKLVLDDLNADRLYRENHAPSAKGEPMQVLERRLRKSILYSQSVIICWGAWQPFSNRSQLQTNGRVQASVSLIGGPRPNPEESLCFKNLLHLYRRDDSVFTESAPKITIQFNFVLEDTRSYDSLSRSTIPTPAPRRETIDAEDTDKEKPLSPKKPELKRDESEATDNEDLLPPIFTKKPTPVTTPKLHQKIDSIIEQESPRQNLPVSYVLPVKEARISNVPRSVYAFLSNVQFPGIFDRDGGPPTLIDVSAGTIPNRAVEMNDPLGTNEIIVQFMAFKWWVMYIFHSM
ncbi:hypothetical protein ANCDUO_02660 [Ancylostoma duodenale]|uniref:Uncharacterized protein n=1 Tax=Ancylostoma duodenale TaxID=51022 RepID=A0A0C2H637_9BILA|nr:hypothetical protein ANCDUO_02660 [Ancylostoma duodenale]